MKLWTEYLTQTITPLEGRGTLLPAEPLAMTWQVVFHKTARYTVKIQPISFLWTSISSNSIVLNSFGNGGQRVVSSVETCRIVGRWWGSVCKQANASFATCATPFPGLISGGGRRWSKTSFKSVLWPNGDDDEEVEADNIRDEMKSPGCFPIITSNVTTPKLYTSHFSSTFIVYASSANETGHAIFAKIIYCTYMQYCIS